MHSNAIKFVIQRVGSPVLALVPFRATKNSMKIVKGELFAFASNDVREKSPDERFS